MGNLLSQPKKSLHIIFKYSSPVSQWYERFNVLQQAQHFGFEKHYFKGIILMFQLLCYLKQTP